MDFLELLRFRLQNCNGIIYLSWWIKFPIILMTLTYYNIRLKGFVMKVLYHGMIPREILLRNYLYHSGLLNVLYGYNNFNVLQIIVNISLLKFWSTEVLFREEKHKAFSWRSKIILKSISSDALIAWNSTQYNIWNLSTGINSTVKIMTARHSSSVWSRNRDQPNTNITLRI